ncbi:MAG: XrtA-associated tyrosine autokinase [Methylococcaceae bacterium]|jgi:exopolysaccharide/PEP-CTERM locus tyrosine autokinase
MSNIEKALEKANLTNSMFDLSHEAKPEDQDVIVGAMERQVVGAVEAQKQAPKLTEKQRLVHIRWDLLKKHGYITKEDSHSQKAEEYRIIKRPLIDNAIGKNSKDIEKSNLILITSSLPGEGKTYSAINLALSISMEMDKQVLLIDADVARPSIAKSLGIQEDMGLIDYLENEDIQFSDIVKDTDVDNLRIICAGKRHQHSTELLASNRMIKLANELSERYADRIVIFDTPPLLVASQGHVLLSLVGQIVLVIEAEKTLRSVVMESVQILSDCDIVLALLNKAHSSIERNYYGYGHYAN